MLPGKLMGATLAYSVSRTTADRLASSEMRAIDERQGRSSSQALRTCF
jgi:hypothetical protein